MTLSAAASQEDGTGQCRHSRGSMYHDTAGKIDYSHLTEESVGMPGPVGQRTIYEDAEQDHENQVAGETYPFRE